MPETANSIRKKNHDNSSADYTWRPRRVGIEDSMHSMTAYSGPDVLWRAWEEVKANGGSAGVDGVRLEEVERRDVALFLEAIARDLKAGRSDYKLLGVQDAVSGFPQNGGTTACLLDDVSIAVCPDT